MGPKKFEFEGPEKIFGFRKYSASEKNAKLWGFVHWPIKSLHTKLWPPALPTTLRKVLVSCLLSADCLDNKFSDQLWPSLSLDEAEQISYHLPFSKISHPNNLFFLHPPRQISQPNFLPLFRLKFGLILTCVEL